MSELSFADYRASEALDQALRGVRSLSSVLCAIALNAGDLLAVTKGHDAAAGMHGRQKGIEI